ncbi:ATP-dependent DNA helicase RecG [Acidisoma cladoniae]|jgi:ATP-dependent DNA helicase RecG|uniref:ATP-dependent DNA helicase RecG n=1 Tax=Acidisoma cladoniae TaxID=3040935 RepID=UPI0025517197|nr:ATP-dependent DNA helicase RecG [Acidisoma sp. PAMC 29798]
MDEATYNHASARCQPLSTLPLAQIRAPLTLLPGIGPRLGTLVTRLVGGPTIRDVLLHMPDSYVDRRERPPLAQAQAGRIVTVEVQVMQHLKPGTKTQPWRVVVTDGSAFVEIVLFHHARLGQMPVGATLVISGKLERYGDRLTLPHPDYVLPLAKAGEMPLIEPVWPLTAGVTNRLLGRAMTGALRQLLDFPEWIEPSLRAQRKWPSFRDAMRLVQAPASPEEAPREHARLRLAYDELLAEQLALSLRRLTRKAKPGRSLVGDGHWRAEALRRFGYEPTGSQIRALAEIDRDLAEPRPMLRLLQGDVGSGKTLVALLAMLRAAEAGTQAALMAPTELLAQQHYRTLSALSPVPVGLLTGSVPLAERRRVMAGLADGTIPIAIGTHALFQKAVTFADLGLAVIDEQHRFGVEQRVSLGDKGDKTDVLVMTATPIPRSLRLTQYGEMEVSKLTEKPHGRGPLRTTVHAISSFPEVIAALARMLDRGARIYWVCPLVSESETLDLTAAEDRFAMLEKRFGAIVGMAHGRQDSKVREAALADFAAGQIRLLVATTVVEVGVDVPEATVMVIEHAERFGLAQLHQLRGRVGRGSADSFCLLLHEDGLSGNARTRLALLRDTQDGFVIADADFKLRGHGDVTGTKQSGLPGYRLADVPDQDALRELARKDAKLLLNNDPTLEGPRGRAASMLLNLFDKVAGVNGMHGG